MDISGLIKKIEAHARNTGMSPHYVARKATGYPKLYERLLRRLESVKGYEKQIDAFIKSQSGE